MASEQPRILTEIFNYVSEVERPRSECLLAGIEAVFRAFAQDNQTVVRVAIQNQPERQTGLVNRKGLAGLLGIAERTISDLQNEGMPCHRFGKSVRYEYQEVLAWSKNRKIRSRGKSKLRMVA